jgi:hypothetical protein
MGLLLGARKMCKDKENRVNVQGERNKGKGTRERDLGQKNFQ